MIKSVVFDFNGVILDSNTHRVHEDMIELVKDLHETGYKLYLFSNTSRHTIDVSDSKYDFLKFFNKVILSEETGLSKPSNQAFENVQTILEDDAGEIAFVDDSRDNIRQAKKYGMQSFLFIDPNRLRMSLATLED